MKPKKQRREESWKWNDIELAIRQVWDEAHHKDSWGVDVMYRDSLLERLFMKLGSHALPTKNKKK